MSLRARLEREREVVARKLPPDSSLEEVGGYPGWLYGFQSELGDDYTMFVYWDGTVYKVKMIYPDPDHVADAHTSHYFADGHLCLKTGVVGYPRLEQAYAKSVLFANAWSIYQRTHEFVF